MTSDSDEPIPWRLLGLLTLFAALLRTIGLDSGLWYDEIRTLQDSVRLPLLRIVTVFPGDNQHTLFSVLAHLSIAVLGDHAWSLRLPSMLFGVATVPLLYLFAREFVGRTEALLASLLLAVFYHHVWFSQSARGYAVLCFLALFSSWLLLRGLRRQRLGDFVAYAVVASLGVYTHATMVLLVASHAMLCVIPLGWPGLAWIRRQRWRLPATGFALAAMLSLLLYAPFLLEVKLQAVAEPHRVEGAASRRALSELLRGLEIGLGSAVAVAGGAVLFAAGAWSFWKQSRFLLGLLVLPGALTIGAAAVLHRALRPRFLLFLAGFALLVVVRGAMVVAEVVRRGSLATDEPGCGVAPRSLPSTGTVLVLLVAVLSAASLPLLYRLPKQDFRGPMQLVDGRHQEHEPVVTAGGATYPYTTYFQKDWQGIRTLEDLQRVRAKAQRVWVLYTFADYIEGDAPQLMRVLRTDCEEEHVFRGTLGNGDVTVCALRPLAAAS